MKFAFWILFRTSPDFIYIAAQDPRIGTLYAARKLLSLLILYLPDAALSTPAPELGLFVWSLLAARLRVFFSFLLRGLFFARDEGCQSPRDVRSEAARTRGSQVQVRSGGPRLTPRYVPAVKRTSDLAAALPRFRFDGLGAPAS